MKDRSQAQKVIRFYAKHVARYPRDVIGICVTLPLTTLVSGLLPPLILANVLSRLSQHQYIAHNIWGSFGPQLVAYVALLLVGTAAWRFVDFFVWSLEGNVERDLAEEVFGFMLRQSADFHANHFAGSLVSQTNKLLSAYTRMADTTVFQVIQLVSGLIFVAIILAPRSPLFVVLLLLFSIFYIISAFWVSKPVQKALAKHAAAESRQTGHLADAITNVMVIKSFAGSDYEQRRFGQAIDTTKQRLFNVARYQRRQLNSLGTISRAISGLSLTMAVIGVLVYNINIATVFLILNYTARIVEQLFDFGNSSLRNYSRSIGDAIEMIELLEQEPSVKDPENPEKPRIAAGAIEFKNVGFTHNGASDALFQKLNLTIAAGEKIGLVGHSGSGKTTFTRVLLRFSDIDSGEILIDGQNIAHVTQDDLHAKLAYVPQEPLLFHRTIKENINYGKPSASDSMIRKVALQAHAAEFINSLPRGYETLVGERGVKLSGGQRQRVAIARAMLKNAPILVLDEATSALDSESEVLIQDALWKLMEGRTTIVIAHRLSTIQKMDRIIVLENGQIAEEGSHSELLQKNGTYAKLWAHQSGGFLEE